MVDLGTVFIDRNLFKFVFPLLLVVKISKNINVRIIIYNFSVFGL